jgi:hypothetical protein
MNETCYRASFTSGACLLLLALGCGKSLPPQTDPNQAREALTAALDAWKEGKSPESLRERKPPVDFRDVAWEKGGKLKSYTVKNEERHGLSVRFTVQLVLEMDGTRRERVVTYNADAGKAVVIRPDF